MNYIENCANVKMNDLATKKNDDDNVSLTVKFYKFDLLLSDYVCHLERNNRSREKVCTKRKLTFVVSLNKFNNCKNLM